MPPSNRPLLVERITGGVDTTSPTHLVVPPQWITGYNFRFSPNCEQVPRKALHTTLTGTTVLALATIPGALPGYGKTIAFLPDQLRTIGDSLIVDGLLTDTSYRRWSIVLYNGCLYYTNELNGVRCTSGSSDAALLNAPSGRYVATWYDHLVVGVPTYKGQRYADRVTWSHLYDFSKWEPDATNEADHYDFVEWQQPDYPFTGVTGMAKLGGTLWVYTPTAIVPLRYVGIQEGVTQVLDDQIVTRCGNTHPWALVALDRVHFFYDGIENNILAFDGQQITPIGEPIRRFLEQNLSTDPSLAAKMWGSVDVENREIWWRFVSTASSGDFDKAIVFNYRFKNWFTASTENVHAFCGSTFTNQTMSQLTGAMNALTGTMANLGAGLTKVPRLYGSKDGKVYREEIPGDATSSLIIADDPVLETGDFLYGSLHAVKEARALSINAAWPDPLTTLEVGVSARDYLDDAVDWSDPANKAGLWNRALPEGRLTHRERSGKVLRYRFVGRNARGIKFTAYEPTIYAQQAEK